MATGDKYPVVMQSQLGQAGGPAQIGSEGTLTPNTAVVTDANGDLQSSTVTATELGYLSGDPGTVANNLASFSLGPTVRVNSGDDLNNYLTAGSFMVVNASVASSLLNSPMTSSGFIFYVFETYGVGSLTLHRLQIAIRYNGDIFRRYRNPSGEFSEWEELQLNGTSLSDLGITASATELNYTSGATSNLQDQINALKSQISSLQSSGG